MAIIERWFSLALSLVWATFSVVGYFCWSWDISQTAVFINIGFLSLFVNYYLAISELSFKDSVIAALNGKRDSPDVRRPFVIAGQILSFAFNQVMFTFALVVACFIAGGLIAAYFYKVLDVVDFDEFLKKWDDQWNAVVRISVLLLIIEYIGFRRQFVKLNPYKITDWRAFMPFTKNSKYKLISYLFGSVIIGSIDGFLNDQSHFGYLSLIWMFVCNFLWAYIDTVYPPKEITVEEYRSEE